MGKKDGVSEIKINVKPLSVNKAWMGRRFKTDEYKRYENFMLWSMPAKFDITNPIELTIEYGFSSKAADIDNPTKLILDILQKKYGFNDRGIMKVLLVKHIVKKGEEFVYIKNYV